MFCGPSTVDVSSSVSGQQSRVHKTYCFPRSQAISVKYALRVLSREGVLLTLSTYTTRLFVLFWNTAAKCGIMPYRAICRTNWKTINIRLEI